MHRDAKMMAGRPGDEDETSLLTATKPKTKRPPLYKVLLLNDDFTPMEFVVHVLERFFGISHAQAVDIMMTVHKLTTQRTLFTPHGILHQSSALGLVLLSRGGATRRDERGNKKRATDVIFTTTQRLAPHRCSIQYY